MITGVDLERWLRERSECVTPSERELVFTHFGQRRSVLLLSSAPSLPVDWPGLHEFFARFTGASLGNGFLVIGSPRAGETVTEDGLYVPSLEEIAEQARTDGIEFGPDELPFATIGGMFVYALRRDGTLVCHDRDFLTTSTDETLGQVLDRWWAQVVADSAH